MTATLTTWLIGAGAALIAFLAAYMRGRITGAQRERDKQMRERMEARDIADQVDNDVGALPPDQARKELGKWSPKR